MMNIVENGLARRIQDKNGLFVSEAFIANKAGNWPDIIEAIDRNSFSWYPVDEELYLLYCGFYIGVIRCQILDEPDALGFNTVFYWKIFSFDGSLPVQGGSKSLEMAQRDLIDEALRKLGH